MRTSFLAVSYTTTSVAEYFFMFIFQFLPYCSILVLNGDAINQWLLQINKHTNTRKVAFGFLLGALYLPYLILERAGNRSLRSVVCLLCETGSQSNPGHKSLYLS